MLVSSAWIWGVLQLYTSVFSVTVCFLHLIFPFVSPRWEIVFPNTFPAVLITNSACPQWLNICERQSKCHPILHVCWRKREKEKEAIPLYLYYFIWTQTTAFSTSSSPISYEEWTAYKLSASNLFAVTWSFHRDLVWPFLTTELQRTQHIFWLSC